MTREHEEEVDRAFEEGQNSMMRSLREARRERDEAREQVRSLTVERDAARAQTGRVCQMLAEEEADSDDLRARLSRAREALGSFDENPPPYRAGHLVEGEWRIHQARALAALRAALSEPPGG